MSVKYKREPSHVREDCECVKIAKVRRAQVGGMLLQTGDAVEVSEQQSGRMSTGRSVMLGHLESVGIGRLVCRKAVGRRITLQLRGERYYLAQGLANFL